MDREASTEFSDDGPFFSRAPILAWQLIQTKTRHAFVSSQTIIKT